MSNLLILVKILTALYQAKNLKDRNLVSELEDLLNSIPETPKDAFRQDRKLEQKVQSIINWVLEQSEDEIIIKSMLAQQCNDFSKDAPETKESILSGLEEFKDEDAARRFVFKHIKDIRKVLKNNDFNDKFKRKLKDFHFGDLSTLPKNEWLALAELINEKIANESDERAGEIVNTVNSDDAVGLLDIINQAKAECGVDGVIVTPFQGLNEALEPDYGLKRGKVYLVNALTNRGKSFTIGHLMAGVALYNKPKLRDKSKIPTVVLDSAEDTLDLILNRMFKLFYVTKYDLAPDDPIKDIFSSTAEEVVELIAGTFKENGWRLIINHIEANQDNYSALCARVRKLERSGHEIIIYFYDYLAMMELDGMTGDTKGDKLQMLYRKTRSFFISRGVCFVTPHQLSPDAKRYLRESDDESEIYFAKDVAGKSMTETSTKITNEVDKEITIHVAKTDIKSYWTYAVGKSRGEGCAPIKRFGIYDIDPKFGLKHDIATKPKFRRNLQTRFDADGNPISTFDDFGN